MTQPTITTPLLDNCSRFVFDAIPNAMYFVQTTKIPGFSLPTNDIKGIFGVHREAGTGMNWEPLNVTFLCDKDLQAWKDIYHWVNGLASPLGFDQYIEKIVDNELHQQTSTARIHLLTPKLNASSNVIVFYNCFPTAVTELNFSTINTEIKAITFGATFLYSHYELLNG